MTEEITYLLANYNNGKYIKDCIASLHAQTSRRWQCLIVDDQSSDDSLAIIRPLLTDKIKLLVNPQNVGYTRTLMRLLEEATTDIVGILDPDDALYPEATERILAAYEAHPNTGFVYAKLRHFQYTLEDPLEIGNSRKIPPGHTNLVDDYIIAPRTFRISTYRQISGFDPSILYAEDRDLIYKMEEVTNLVFVDQVLYKYRRIPGSQTTDPIKYRIGRKNQLRAYRYALQRRNINGMYRLIYLLHGYCRYLHTEVPPRPWLRAAMKYCRVATEAWVVQLEQRRMASAWRNLDGHDDSPISGFSR